MTNRQQATKAILDFLNSNDRVLLLTGTHQFSKHVLVLSSIFKTYKKNATILFRANSQDHFNDYLSPVIDLSTQPRTGVPINVENRFDLYVDTINPRTWRVSPSNIDLAILYPLDSLDYETGDKCVQDLIKRKVQKLFLVSWTDNVDFGWTEQFNPIKVSFDIEEENPEGHQRIIEYQQQHGKKEQISEQLPDYAKNTPQEYLVKIFCRGRCRGATKWAKLNKPYPGRTTIRSASMGTYLATCLVCGYEATDNHNWYR